MVTQAVFTAKIIEDKSFFSRLSCAVKKSIVLHYCTVFASIETIFICSVRKNILLHYFIVFTSVLNHVILHSQLIPWVSCNNQLIHLTLLLIDYILIVVF